MKSVHRSEFMHPKQVAFNYYFYDPLLNGRMKNRRYERLKDGRWMHVIQVQGEYVHGDIWDYPTFCTMMAYEENRKKRLRAEYNTYCFLFWLAVGGLVFGLWLGERRELEGAAVAAVCVLAIIVLLGLIYKFGMAIRGITVVDPGRPIVFEKDKMVRDQNPWGGPGVADPDDAADQLGASPGGRRT